MGTQAQAYIQGFVKRANEYGFNNDEAVELLKEAKDADPFTYGLLSGVPLATGFAGKMLGGTIGGGVGLFAGALPGALYGQELAEKNRKMRESIGEVSFPHRLGGMLGGLALGGVAGANLDHPMEGLALGGLLGRMVGGGLGAQRYNELLKK